MAAAYLYHIVQNHPFIDGNKRTGAAAAIIFLSMNDMEFIVEIINRWVARIEGFVLISTTEVAVRSYNFQHESIRL